MKLVIAIFLMCACTTTSAKEVVAVGHGTTENSALQNAKREATYQVAGTFLISQTDIDRDSVKERISEYSGGFIRRYEVFSVSTQDDLVEVVIKADVDEGKINAVALSSGHLISEAAIAALENSRSSYEKLENALDTVMDNKNKIYTEIKSVKYTVTGLKTRVLIEFEAGWLPKWFDDLRSIAKTSGPDLGLFKYKDYGVCFYGDRKLLLKSLECYDIHSELDLPNDITFTALAHMQNNSVNMGDVYLIPTALYYHRTDPVFGRELTMYKNGVLRGSVIFDIDTKTLEQVSSFNITASLSEPNTGSADISELLRPSGRRHKTNQN